MMIIKCSVINKVRPKGRTNLELKEVKCFLPSAIDLQAELNRAVFKKIRCEVARYERHMKRNIEQVCGVLTYLKEHIICWHAIF